MNPLRSRHPSRPSLWLGTLLVLAVLWTQSLGLLHRAVHAPVAAGIGVSLPAPLHAVGGVEALLGHSDQTPECRLFSQLALGDLVSPGTVAFAPVLVSCSSAPLAILLPTGAARHHYCARAPPTIA